MAYGPKPVMYPYLQETVTLKTDNSCWEWSGSHTPKGYAILKVNGHLFDESNTFWFRGRNNRLNRRCRACHCERERSKRLELRMADGSRSC